MVKPRKGNTDSPGLKLGTMADPSTPRLRQIANCAHQVMTSLVAGNIKEGVRTDNAEQWTVVSGSDS